jgi:hypothetical protein
MLCHGKKHGQELCFTSIIDPSHATLLDKDPKCNPHVVHDLRKPITFKKKFDLITTMCCDTDAFYSIETKNIVDQSFINIAAALKRPGKGAFCSNLGGVFIMPKYFWLNKRVIDQIGRHLVVVKKFKTEYDTFYVFAAKKT